MTERQRARLLAQAFRKREGQPCTTELAHTVAFRICDGRCAISWVERGKLRLQKIHEEGKPTLDNLVVVERTPANRRHSWTKGELRTIRDRVAAWRASSKVEPFRKRRRLDLRELAPNAAVFVGPAPPFPLPLDLPVFFLA
jgi:hypothetical protein